MSVPNFPVEIFIFVWREDEGERDVMPSDIKQR